MEEQTTTCSCSYSKQMTTDCFSHSFISTEKTTSWWMPLPTWFSNYNKQSWMFFQLFLVISSHLFLDPRDRQWNSWQQKYRQSIKVDGEVCRKEGWSSEVLGGRLGRIVWVVKARFAVTQCTIRYEWYVPVQQAISMGSIYQFVSTPDCTICWYISTCHINVRLVHCYGPIRWTMGETT